MSVRPSVRTYKLGSDWTYLHGTGHWEHTRIYVEKIQILLKADKKYRAL
jgi:hypothetical protein